MPDTTEQHVEGRYGLMLSGELREIDGKVVLLSSELPISGIGSNVDEAVSCLLGACRAYLGALESQGEMVKDLLAEPPAGRITYQIPYIGDRA